jgi:predicted DCC family thiol-disulfide oxidoreductase YuxK
LYGVVIVLFDADCGFCRWAMAWALRLDRRHLLVAVPIQSALGAELLADLEPSERLSAARVVDEDGRRLSGGAAAAEALGALPPTRGLARLARRLPGTTELLYTAAQAARPAGERRRTAARRSPGEGIERHDRGRAGGATALTGARPAVRASQAAAIWRIRAG